MIHGRINVRWEDDTRSMNKNLKIFYDDKLACYTLFNYMPRQEFYEQVARSLYQQGMLEADIQRVMDIIINPPRPVPIIKAQPDNSIYYDLFRFFLSLPTVPYEIFEALRITENNIERQKKVLELQRETENERKEYERKYGTLKEKLTSYL